MEFNIEDEIDFDFLDNEDEILDEFSKPDSVLFLVDTQAFKFHNENIEQTNLEIVSQAYLNFLKDKLLASQSDKSSLIFYNTVTHNNDFSFPGIFVVHPLDGIHPQRILHSEETFNNFEQRIGTNETEANFLEVLWVCNAQFRGLPSNKKFFKRIFVFTANDCPNKDGLEFSAEKIADYFKVD